jgi:hypothetical protein
MIDCLDRLARESWHEWMGASAGEPPALRWVIVSGGGAAYHDNVVLFGLAAGQTQPVLVAKVCRLPMYDQTVRAEHRHLVTLWQILGEEAWGRLPRPLALAQCGSDVALLTDYSRGRGLLFASRADLWSDSHHRCQLARRAAESLRFIHERTAASDYHTACIEPDFRARADLFCSLFDPTDEEARELEHLSRLVEKTWAESPGNVLIQGDFWHGNLIESAEAGTLTFVDWQFARWSPDASLDVYLFLLAGALSAAPYGPAQERARDAARLLVQWQSDLIPAYLEAYGQPERYALLSLRAGMLACCVEMATRPAFTFNARHPDDLMWRALFAALCAWPDPSPIGGAP